MALPWTNKQPEAVAVKVLQRAEINKMARTLQSHLALAGFKAKHGWQDLSLDIIEPKVEEQLKRQRPSSSGDVRSESSSSTSSEFQYPRTLVNSSSPVKAPFFSDAINSSSGSSGHRKRNYNTNFPHPESNMTTQKRLRSSPSRSLNSSHSSWKDQHQLSQSSPIKPRKSTHFTTSAGPNISFFRGTASTLPDQAQPSFAANSDDEDDDLLPAHSFKMTSSMDARSSPPRTPPTYNRAALGRRGNSKNVGGKSGEEGADLLLYLATSPSPANPNRSRMQPPSTPPQRHLALPSSMMNTPGGGGGLLSGFGNPHTPNQGFDFADFVNITPSPAQNAWIRTPGTTRTPATISRRGLTFDNVSRGSPGITSNGVIPSGKNTGLGMQLGGDLIP